MFCPLSQEHQGSAENVRGKIGSRLGILGSLIRCTTLVTRSPAPFLSLERRRQILTPSPQTLPHCGAPSSAAPLVPYRAGLMCLCSEGRSRDHTCSHTHISGGHQGQTQAWRDDRHEYLTSTHSFQSCRRNSSFKMSSVSSMILTNFAHRATADCI